MCPPALRGSLTGVPPVSRPTRPLRGLNPLKSESQYLESKPAGPKAGKVSVHPFQRVGRSPRARRDAKRPVRAGGAEGAAPRSPVATGEILFRRELFSLLLSFCDRKRKKEALRPMPRAAPWTRGGGSFGDKRLPPFGAEKPDGPVPGCRAGYPSKTSRWDVFESSGPAGRKSNPTLRRMGAGSGCKEKKESKTTRQRMRGSAWSPHHYYTVEPLFLQSAECRTLYF